MNNQITRRTAVAVLGSATLRVAFGAHPLLADESSADALAKLLPHFTEESRALLRRLLAGPNYSGQIPATEAARLAHNENTTIEKLMVSLLPFAQSYCACADF